MHDINIFNYITLNHYWIVRLEFIGRILQAVNLATVNVISLSKLLVPCLCT